jgi:hypothetical protein
LSKTQFRRLLILKVRKTYWFISTFFIAILLFSALPARSDVIFSDDYLWSGSFEGRGYEHVTSYAEKLEAGGYGDNGGCLRIYGGHPVEIPIPGDRLELYIRFYFRVTNSTAGQKWLKIFGQRDGDTYTNTTFQRIYDHGYFRSVVYGADCILCDCQNTLNYTGDWFPGSEWTYYEAHIKFADGPEWNNGVVEVWCGDDKKLSAHGVNNRNSAHNGLYISRISFSDYSRNPDSEVGYMWIDNIVISDDRIGPVGGSSDDRIGPVGGSNEDTLSPTTAEHSPIKGAACVTPDSNAIVHVWDTGDGVDQSSIVMTVNGERVNPAISGSPADYTVSYNPPVDFTPGDVVTVTVDAQDQHNPANIMPQDRYSFTIADAGGEDKQPGEGDTKVFGDVSGSDYRGTCQDTFVNAGARSSNYSNDSQSLNTYTWPTNTSANRIVMKWDLSAIPQNATIHEATLSLDVYSASGDESYEVSAHKIVANNPDISSCTWNTYDGVHSWTGGANGGEQALAPAESTAIVDRTAGYKNCSITQMVQQWVSNPSSNYGLMLDSDSTAASDSNRLFRPTEYSNPDQRPKLTVTYSDSSKISPPENLRLVH